MGCRKTLTLNPAAATGDMPLDQAIFDPTTGKIFGTRSGWLYQFNGTTGVLEATLRAAPLVYGRSSLTVIGPDIFIGAQPNDQALPIDSSDFSGAGHPYVNPPTMDIYRVTASGLVNHGPLGLPVIENGGSLIGDIIAQGYNSLVTDGTSIWFYGLFTGIVRITNPLSPTGNYHRWSLQLVQDMVYDPTNVALWTVDSQAPNLWVWSPSNYSDFLDTFNNGSIHPLYGVDYSTAENKVYVVGGTETLYVVPSSEIALIFPLTNFYNFNMTTLHTGQINAVPVRCKACPYTTHPYAGKLLIPTWSDDTVLVWNMKTDDVGDMVIKSGFSSPIDIVFTPNSAFAVQQSAIGLKEVT